jgi:hypothetical protein
MILVSVRSETEASLARALVHALQDSFEFFVLFASAPLARTHGAKFPRSGCDAALCALNARNFELLIVFSGRLTAEDLPNLQWISFLHELGIATLEIQHRFLQFDELQPFEIGHAARHVLRWGGEHGIGYLKSEVNGPPTLAKDHVLFVPSPRLPEEERYKFAIAALKLAASSPELRFVWSVHPSERHLRSKGAPGASSEEVTEPVSTMIADYHLPNLSVERNEPAENLVPGCLMGISCLSTVLLDLHRHGKPAVVYRSFTSSEAGSSLRAQTFSSTAELIEAVRKLRQTPSEYQLHVEMEPLNRSRLADAVRGAAQGSTPRDDWQPMAIAFASRSTAAEVQVEPPNLELERLSKELTRLSERITVLQRSTLAYKAKKLATRLGKPER